MKTTLEYFYSIKGNPVPARLANFKTILFGYGSTPSITVDRACTTGISVTGATGVGINIEGTIAGYAIQITATTGSAIGIFSGTFDYGVNIASSGTVGTGIIIAGACTTAINVAVAQTDESGLDAAAVFQHGSYDTALVYGTQAVNLVLKSTHITAAATGVYVFGDINYMETSADSTGYMMPSYDYLSVGHNLVNGYAGRHRIAITAECQLGEQAAVLGSMEVGAHAVTVTGGAVLTAGLFDLEVTTGATIEQEACCIEVRPRIRANVDGSTSGIRVNVNCEVANYLDYGIDIRSMSSNQTAALRILMTGDSAALPAGITIEGQNSSTSTITAALKINGLLTYFADFSGCMGANASITSDSGTAALDWKARIKVKTDDGTVGWINVYSTSHEA